jgi:fused signal recognition particle receptor
MLKFWKKSPTADSDVPADTARASVAVTTPVVAPAPPAEPAAEPKRSWLDRLKTGLKKTSAGLTGLFLRIQVDESLFEELEDALLLADCGVEATQWLITELRARAKSKQIEDGAQLKAELAELIVTLLTPLEKTLPLVRADGAKPLVMLIAGVNGAGKTTSIGKLAKHFQLADKRVLLAAGDTFRAAAREQLMVWGERNGVQVIAQDGGDPAAVIFDAVASARARGFDLLMADTAGRLPTQLHLMEELKKIRRVIAKGEEGAPHETLLVIDGNTGQNALAQVRAFDGALGLTGLIVTKLDGTAKGGVLCAIARTCPVPVYFIGVGEGLDDLAPFNAREFASALLG